VDFFDINSLVKLDASLQFTGHSRF